MTKFNDPKIRLDKAIEIYNNKSGLAKELEISRTCVTDWVNHTDMVYLPPLHAYRLIGRHPEVFGD
jgi:hypothetical protein